MTVFSSLIDQAEVITVLREAVMASRNNSDTTQAMTHTWLFTGPPGSGRSNAAVAFAAEGAPGTTAVTLNERLTVVAGKKVLLPG